MSSSNIDGLTVDQVRNIITKNESDSSSTTTSTNSYTILNDDEVDKLLNQVEPEIFDEDEYLLIKKDELDVRIIEGVNKILDKTELAKQIKKQLEPGWIKWTYTKSLNGLKNTIIIGSATLTIGSFIFYVIK